MTKLSIIVPVYNVKEYLQKCVDSLLAQDYDDYEIILVDDGSTDQSGLIADQIVENWKLKKEKGEQGIGNREQGVYVRVIHQENRGLSGARNTGIEAAMGEYVCFVDSDDYWEPNVLGGLMEQIERDLLDVLRFDYRIVDEAGCEFWPIKSPKVMDKEKTVVSGLKYMDERMGSQCYAVQFIIRKAKCPKFREGIVFEDIEWIPRMFWYMERVIGTETIVYNYYWRQGTISRGGNRAQMRKKIHDMLTIVKIYHEQLEKRPKSRWLQRIQSENALSCLITIAENDFEHVDNYIQQLKQEKVFPLQLHDQIWTIQKKMLLINVSPKLYCAIMHYKKK